MCAFKDEWILSAKIDFALEKIRLSFCSTQTHNQDIHTFILNDFVAQWKLEAHRSYFFVLSNISTGVLVCSSSNPIN